jgi:hypothetical protein
VSDEDADEEDEPTPIDARRAASRSVAAKQVLLDDAEVQAWRRRARALAGEAPLLGELLEAVPASNGVAH